MPDSTPPPSTSTVLIVTEAGDDHARVMRSALISRGSAVWIWDVTGFPRATPFSIHFEPGSPQTIRGVLTTGEGELALETVTAVWMRRSMLGLFAPLGRPDDIGVYVGFELEAAFRGLTDVLRNAVWVNPPAALYAIEPAIAQMKAARAAGLRVASGDPAGANIKIVVAGRRMFNFELPPSGDYRITNVPDDIGAACVRLVQTAGLVLASIRLVRSTDDDYVFLGLSANPDWLRLEQATGQPVTKAVAEILG